MANRSVQGLGKWYAKFRIGKFRPGIAFTICTNQSHLPKNDREGLNPVSKMALKKWNTNFRLEYSVQKNRTTFSDFLSLHCYRAFSGGKTQKVVCHLLSNLIFRKILVHGKQQVISITITWQKLKHTEACRVQHEDFFLLLRASKDFYLVLVQRNLLHFNSTSIK